MKLRILLNFILCGFPCCGKTTVGERLAEHLKYEFIDTDRLIEKRFKEMTQREYSCKQIFLEMGSEAFRNLEKEVVFSLENKEKCVIALGGGAILNEECVTVLKRLGTVIYLKATRETLLERMRLRGAPAYFGQESFETEFLKMWDVRHPLYERVADISIETQVAL